MNNTRKMPARRGIEVSLLMNDQLIAGQLNGNLSRSVSSIDTTNQIKGEWEESIPGAKSWSLTIQCLSIKDEQTFKDLEQAFEENILFDISIQDNEVKYRGKGYISNFPYQTNFSDAIVLNFTVQGTGPLIKVNFD